jgi:hypothetical protein
VEPKRESDTERPETKIPGFPCLLGVVFLPLLGWLVEVSHWVSPLTQGSVLLGVIVGATLCAVYGLSSISKGPPVRLKTYIPGLACVLGADLYYTSGGLPKSGIGFRPPASRTSGSVWEWSWARPRLRYLG